jgi:hypothetical protein
MSCHDRRPGPARSSSRVDELIDLSFGLEPGDIAFDRVLMHFAE